MLIKNTLHITYLFSFKTASKRYNFYVNIYDASKRTPLTKAFKRHSAFLPSRTRLNLTKIQIMQLKRSYSRRLKFEIIIYEYNFITRRAYKSIKLAVKTSRPQYFKDTFYGVTFRFTSGQAFRYIFCKKAKGCRFNP